MASHVDAAQDLNDLDDFSSAWADVRANGDKWGGRGKGGRGVARQYQCQSTSTRDISIDGVTLSFSGRHLLNRTRLRITHGERYALMGRNGVGKSTLLKRMASGDIPGFPLHLRLALVAQEEDLLEDPEQSVLEHLVDKVVSRQTEKLEAERDTVEAALDDEELADEDIEALAERLGVIEEELEGINPEKVEDACVKVLKGLGFKKRRRLQAVGELSGGWRMRLRLAAALQSNADVILLDEPTNHLDLHGVLWLEAFLAKREAFAADAGIACPDTVVFVSHDESFCSAVATQIINFANAELTYFNGGYDDYLSRAAEASANHARRLDARVRQEEKAQNAAAHMQRAARGGNDKAARQAKQKLNKVDRIGLGRSDGKRFALQSLKKLDASASRLAERVEGKAREREEKFQFPAPDRQALRAGGGDVDLVSFDGVDCAYAEGEKVVLEGLNLRVTLGSRVAVVGDNGAGKTTLLKAILGETDDHGQGLRVRGEVRRNARARLAYVPQHHLSALEDHLSISAMEYVIQQCGAASELDARTKLGKFGLAGDFATQPMASLSGGQRVRVSLAVITWDEPHAIVFDEPTNHLDLYALRALATALGAYEGGVVLVSHNRAFCNAFCRELWVVADGGLTVQRASEDEGSFEELFAAYASGVSGTDATTSANNARARQLDKARNRGNRRGGAKKGSTKRSALL
mmetsp:Transcript_14885/g.44844  ORF Transcript_14885/g.44844 Transcript_14885/m.44844 type:complete len:694 (-) Transcript_14885:87-2168(-)